MATDIKSIPKWAIEEPRQWKDRWFRGIMSIHNNSLPDTCKMIMYILYGEFASKEQDSEGFISVYYGNGTPGEGITGRTGYSRQIVSRSIKQLVDADILLRRIEVGSDKKKHVYLAPTALFYDPANCQLKDKREWGGNRVKCPACGSEELIASVTVTCKNCGEVHRIVGSYYVSNDRIYYDDRPTYSYWDN